MPLFSPPVGCDVENDGSVQVADFGAGGGELVFGAGPAGEVGAVLWLWVGAAPDERDGVGVGVGFGDPEGLESGVSDGAMLRPAGPGPPPRVILATGSPVLVD